MAASWLNWPNRISIARILLVPPWVICLLKLNSGWEQARHTALLLFVVMTLSDVLDGYLARRLNETSDLGAFLDPLADKFLIACAVVILAIAPTSVRGAELPSWVPVIALGKDVLTVSGFMLVYMTTGRIFIRPRVWGKGCTLVQSVMIAVTLLSPDLPPWVTSVLLPGLWYLASGIAILALLDYLRIGHLFVGQVATRNKL